MDPAAEKLVAWIRSKAIWHEANQAYGNIAQALHTLADELEGLWSPKPSGDVPPDVTPPQ